MATEDAYFTQDFELIEIQSSMLDLRIASNATNVLSPSSFPHSFFFFARMRAYTNKIRGAEYGANVF
jgi:hypothetical protein